MKILFFNQSNYPFSGTDTFLVNLVKNWSPDDEKVIMYNESFPDLQLVIDHCKDAKNVKYISLNIPTLYDIYSTIKWLRALHPILKPVILLIYIVKLLPVIKKINPDAIISINGGYPAGEMNLSAVIAAKILGIKKIILNIHNFPKRKASVISFDFLLDLIISWASEKIVTVSKACMDDLKKKRKFYCDVVYIHNGIEVRKTLIEKKSLKNFGIKPTDKIVGFVGLLEERKGVHYLIDAMYKVIKEVPDSKLIIIGNGDRKYKDVLLNRCIELGIRKNIIFTGHIKNAQGLIRLFDVFVLPSIEFESFGLVILEAMLNKVPVISTDVGGIPEIIEDGKTGFVVKAKDVDMLADRIIYLLKNKNIAIKMGESGYNKLISEFTADKMAKKYEALVKDL